MHRIKERGRDLLTILLIIVCAISYPVSSAVAQHLSPGGRLQEAMSKEEVDGDLKSAIDIYRSIANDRSSPASIRSKALLRLAICSEKLSSQNVRTMLKQVIRDYPASPEAAEARMQLTLLRKTPPLLPTRRQIVIPDAYGEIFSDGQRVIYEEHDWRGALIVADLDGSNKRIFYQPKTTDFITSFYPSRDLGIVLLIRHPPGDAGERLAIVQTSDGHYRDLTHLAERSSFRPAWNWSGTAFVYERIDRKGPNSFNRRLVTITAADGTERPVCDLGNDRPFAGALSPDGRTFALISGPILQYGEAYASRAWVMPADGTLAGPAQFVASVNSPLIDWSVDGRSLILSRTVPGELPKLTRFQMDGTHVGVPTDLDSWENSGPGYFSPTGSLVYQKGPDPLIGNFYMGNIDAAGNLGSWQLLKSAGGDRPVWSPDGQQLIYVRNALGNPGFRRPYEVWSHTSDSDKSQLIMTVNASSPPDCIWVGEHSACAFQAGWLEFDDFRFPIRTVPGVLRSMNSLPVEELHKSLNCSTSCEAQLYTVVDRELIVGVHHDGAPGNEATYELVRIDLQTYKSTVKMDWGEPLPVRLSQDGRYALTYKNNGAGVISLAVREVMPGSSWRAIAQFRTPFDLPAVGPLAISPDGTIVYYEDDDSAGAPSLFRVSINGDTLPARVGSYPTPSKGRLVISADGKNLLAVDPEGKHAETWILRNLPPVPQ